MATEANIRQRTFLTENNQFLPSFSFQNAFCCNFREKKLLQASKNLSTRLHGGTYSAAAAGISAVCRTAGEHAVWPPMRASYRIRAGQQAPCPPWWQDNRPWYETSARAEVPKTAKVQIQRHQTDMRRDLSARLVSVPSRSTHAPLLQARAVEESWVVT